MTILKRIGDVFRFFRCNHTFLFVGYSRSDVVGDSKIKLKCHKCGGVSSVNKEQFDSISNIYGVFSSNEGVVKKEGNAMFLKGYDYNEKMENYKKVMANKSKLREL